MISERFESVWELLDLAKLLLLGLSVLAVASFVNANTVGGYWITDDWSEAVARWLVRFSWLLALLAYYGYRHHKPGDTNGE